MPALYWIGRTCDEFHCLPSAAWAEWGRLPEGVLEQILEQRSYARAWHVYESAPDKSKLPRDAVMQLVKIIDFELADEDIRARSAAN